MKRLWKLVILVCLAIFVGGAIWFLSQDKPSLMAQARMLRVGMTSEEVKKILGAPDRILEDVPDETPYGVPAQTYVYEGDRDIKELISRKPPFVHPEAYRWNTKWHFWVNFTSKDSGGTWHLYSITIWGKGEGRWFLPPQSTSR